MVTINPISHGGLVDLAAILPAGPDAVVVPKCESKADVLAVENAINGAGLVKQVSILPMLEVRHDESGLEYTTLRFHCSGTSGLSIR